MDWVEGIGNSVDEAKNMALEALGIHEDDAEIEIVAEAKVGLFNRVKEQARVKARVRPSTPRSKDDKRRRRGRTSGGPVQGEKRGGSRKGSGDQRSKSGGKQKSKKRDDDDGNGSSRSGAKDGKAAKKESGGTEAAGGNQDADGKQGNRKPKQNGGRDSARKSKDDNMETMTLPEQADVAEEFVTGLAERFDQTVTFERTDVDETEIRIEVSGDNLGRMIGRRGATADAIDELVRTILQRRAGSGRDGRVRIDIGGVNSRREEALRAFAAKVGDQVMESGKELALEPMRSNDRRIVHDALSEVEGVETISEGEDPSRRVVVLPRGNDS